MAINLNAYELRFNKDKISIYRTKYNKDLLYKLISKFKDFSFYRLGDFIYSWPVKKTSETLPSNFENVVIDLFNDNYLFSNIIERSFKKYFEEKDYIIYRKKYSNYYEFENKKSETNFDFNDLKLSTCKQYSVRTICNRDGKKYLFVFSDKNKIYFLSNKDDLGKKGINTEGWEIEDNGKIIPKSDVIFSYLSQTNLLEKFREKEKELQNNKNLYNNFSSSLKIIKGISKNIYLPDDLSISEIIFCAENFIRLNQPKKYYFNDKENNSGYFQNRIKISKPYSFNLFSNKTIKIKVLTYQKYKSDIQLFISKFKNVLSDTFHLKIEIEIEEINSKNTTFSENKKYLNFSNIDLVLLALDEQEKNKPLNNSEYYRVKANLLQLGIPTQTILYEKIIDKTNLNLYLDTISLNVYGKLGGLGWAIEKKSEDKNEIIIGVSSTNDSINKVTGFTSIFDYDGKYLFGNCSQLTNYENYKDELSRHIEETIKTLINSKNIKSGETINIIFHIFKEVGRNNEVQAIKNAIKKINNYSITYAFVHLSYKHNYKFFNDQGKNKVEKGYFLKLSENSGLLSTDSSKGIPILIKLNKHSTYKDFEKIVNQIYDFMFLSHTSYLIPKKPITMLYSLKMIELMAKIASNEKWNTFLPNSLDEKLWFI